MTVMDDARWARRMLADLNPAGGTEAALDDLVGEVRDKVRERCDGDSSANRVGGNGRGVSLTVPNQSHDKILASSAGSREARPQGTSPARRRAWIAAAGLVTIIAAAGAVTTLGESNDGAVTAGPPADGVDEASSSPIWATAESGGVEVRVETEGPVTVGTRTPVRFTIRNTRAAPIYWRPAGCASPVDTTFGPAGSPPAVEAQEEDVWDGTPGSLGQWVKEHNALPLTTRHQPEDATGIRDHICDLVGTIETIAAGAELRHNGSFEVRVPPGQIPAGDSFNATTTFTWYDKLPDDADPGPGSPISVQVNVPVIDDPDRSDSSADAALGAMGADPRLHAWLTSTQPASAENALGYEAELSWWRNEWELWLTPRFANAPRPLRMRFNPTTGTVTDVRAVILGLAPADEPGAVRPSQATPDEVFEVPPTTTTSTSAPAPASPEGEEEGSASVGRVEVQWEKSVQSLAELEAVSTAVVIASPSAEPEEAVEEGESYVLYGKRLVVDMLISGEGLAPGDEIIVTRWVPAPMTDGQPLLNDGLQPAFEQPRYILGLTRSDENQDTWSTVSGPNSVLPVSGTGTILVADGGDLHGTPLQRSLAGETVDGVVNTIAG